MRTIKFRSLHRLVMVRIAHPTSLRFKVGCALRTIGVPSHVTT
jgi:hypothetical protein